MVSVPTNSQIARTRLSKCYRRRVCFKPNFRQISRLMVGRACRLDVSQHFSGSQNEPQAFLYGLPHNGKRLTDSAGFGVAQATERHQKKARHRVRTETCRGTLAKGGWRGACTRCGCYSRTNAKLCVADFEFQLLPSWLEGACGIFATADGMPSARCGVRYPKMARLALIGVATARWGNRWGNNLQLRIQKACIHAGFKASLERFRQFLNLPVAQLDRASAF